MLSTNPSSRFLSILGVNELNYQVRNVTGCTLTTMRTKQICFGADKKIRTSDPTGMNRML